MQGEAAADVPFALPVAVVHRSQALWTTTRAAPRLRLPAVRVATPLAALAHTRGTARVLATFQRSAYLELVDIEHELAAIENAAPVEALEAGAGANRASPGSPTRGAGARVTLQEAGLPDTRSAAPGADGAHEDRSGRTRAHAGDVPRLVALTSPHLEPGPFDAAVAGFEHLRAALYATAGPVRLDRGVLTVGDVEVNLRAGARWDPEVPRPWGDGDAPHTSAARRAVEQVLREAAPPESLAGLLWRGGLPADHTLAHRGHPERLGGLPSTGADLPDRLAPFARALEILASLFYQPARAGLPAARGSGEALLDRTLPNVRQPDDACAQAAALVAGLGPGLTPSGDDLLCGVMLATWVWPTLAGAEHAAEVRARIATAARPRTTRVGAAYLLAAQRGWAPRPWHRLARALDNAPAARAAALQVVAIGETSGADGLTGFCWAWRVVSGPQES
ncbi:MAG: DUF2877 domain-containing protein [Armatimonadota bacterium]|nr:DUF2877 domain-containing protein [Armatimonadota bacterium]